MPIFTHTRKKGSRTTQHIVVFQEAIDRAEFEAFVVEQDHFGYSPLGYDGWSLMLAEDGARYLTPPDALPHGVPGMQSTHWAWVHYNSCD